MDNATKKCLSQEAMLVQRRQMAPHTPGENGLTYMLRTLHELERPRIAQAVSRYHALQTPKTGNVNLYNLNIVLSKSSSSAFVLFIYSRYF